MNIFLNKINGTTHKTSSFNSILEQSISIAKTLYETGVRQNDVISIVSENRHEFPAIAFGALYLSAIVAPINVTYTEREIILLSGVLKLSSIYEDDILFHISQVN